MWVKTQSGSYVNLVAAESLTPQRGVSEDRTKVVAVFRIPPQAAGNLADLTGQAVLAEFADEDAALYRDILERLLREGGFADLSGSVDQVRAREPQRSAG